MKKISFSKQSILPFAKSVALLTLGAIFYAIGVSLFVEPNEIAPGGISGIGILVNHLTKNKISVGLFYLSVNIPLLIIAFLRFKFTFFASTLYVIILNSLAIDFFGAQFEPLTKDPMLAAIIGGTFIAFGIGLSIHGNGSTGGTDIIVKLLRQRFKQFKSGILFFIMDAIVIVLSAFAFDRIEAALYAAISVFVTSVLVDYVLYGPDGAKVIYVISSKPSAIADRLMHETDCGITYLDGQGGYSGVKHQVLMCVFHKHLYPKVRRIVTQEDENAFMIVASAHEVFGEGFKNHSTDEI